MRGALRGGFDARLLALALIASACESIDDIDVEVSGSAAIAARTVIDDLTALVPFEGLDEVDFEQEFRNQGVAEEDVDSVRVKRFVLTLASPPSQSFDFLERVAFFASADGLPEVRIASVDAIDPETRTIELALDDVELEPYATAERMRVRAEVEGQRPEEPSTLRADVKFEVDVTVPGCE